MALSTPIDLTSRGFGANAGVTTSGYPHSQHVADSVVKNVSIRFNGADATAVKGAAIATSDVFPLVTVPAGAVVLSVQAKVVTAEGGTCTFGIGDGGSTSRFLSAQNGNSTSTYGTYVTPYAYTAADTIDLILSSGTAAAVVADISVSYIAAKPNAI